jgi:hypothetical protein
MVSVLFLILLVVVVVAAFQASTALNEHKNKLETHMNALLMGYRQKMQMAQGEHERKRSLLKQRWREEKAQYDANRMKKYLPSNWHNTPVGTSITQRVCNHYPEQTAGHIVSNCLADIVDGVVVKEKSNAKDEPFRAFEEPPFDPKTVVLDPTTGETVGQHQQRSLGPLQKEIQAVGVKLNAAEDERKRAWKKLTKAKQDFDSQMAARVQVSGNTPPLRTSSAQSAHVNPRAQVSSYMPNQNRGNTLRTAQGYAPSGCVNVNDSKYSSARVRQRIGNDGSVAPVTTPKQTSDGYYQRPTGRGRKGMEWDPVNGVWVPRNN